MLFKSVLKEALKSRKEKTEQVAEYFRDIPFQYERFRFCLQLVVEQSKTVQKAANDDDSEQGFQLRPSRQIGCQEKGAAYSLFSEGHGSSPLEGIVGLGLDEREDHNQPPVKKVQGL